MNKTIWAIAWRNVWRNKLRSIIIICAVTVGLFGAIVYYTFAMGLMQQRIESAISNEISNIQIHTPEYLLNEEVKFTIPQSHRIVDEIKAIDGVKAVSSRLKSMAMASTAETGTGVMLNGIEPKNEVQVTKLFKQLIEGEYLKDSDRIPILVGQKLAKKLNARLKSRIVITVANIDGIITYGAFRIVGIYHTENDMFDEMNVFVRKNDLANLLNVKEEDSNELAIALYNHDLSESITDQLKAKYSTEIDQEKLSIRSWKEIVPSLNAMIAMMNYFGYVFLIIILFALAFGIVNTMLMVVMERTKEIGMLKAIGMVNRRIFSMIMLETIFLSIIGGLFGLAISILCVEYYGNYGFSLEAFKEGYNSLGFSSMIYPKNDWQFYISTTILVIITAILSSIYPARKALKLRAVDAIKDDN